MKKNIISKIKPYWILYSLNTGFGSASSGNNGGGYFSAIETWNKEYFFRVDPKKCTIKGCWEDWLVLKDNNNRTLIYKQDNKPFIRPSFYELQKLKEAFCILNEE